MDEGGMIDGVNIAKTPPSSSRCMICHEVKDVKKNIMMKSCCPVHFGYACYTCLRKYYIEKPKSVYDFPFECSRSKCHHIMSHNWIQSLFAKGGRQMTMRVCRSEYAQYCKMKRLARRNENILGPNWKIILKDLRTVNVIMGISGPLARNSLRAQFGIKYDLDGFAKCCNCRTIVLKDGGCDHMTCLSCGADYSYRQCELKIHTMDIGYVRLSSDMNKDNQRRRRHIRPRLVTVKEDATTLWEEGIGNSDVKDDEEKFSIFAVASEELDAEVGTDETKTSSNKHNEEEGDAISDIDEGFSAIDADEDMNQSWSVVSSGEQTRLSSSASSFSVISGVDSVCSFDDFSDLASIDDTTDVADEKANPLMLGISYCDVVKKALNDDINTVGQNKVPRRNRTAKLGIAAKPTASKDKNEHDDDCDDAFIYNDCLKYNGRGGKQSLRYCGGSSQSGHSEKHSCRGSKLTRKQRKIRRTCFLWNYSSHGCKRRPGQRCGFQTTKSAVQQYYTIKN